MMKLLIHKTILILSLLMSFMFSAASFALDPVYTGFFSNEAIKGYDTVAYFTENKALKGKSEFSIDYKGASWLFLSQENLALFKAEPEKYVPQYGGYCAYAVSQGTTASIKPELFTIHNGKLYLNYNKKINAQWSANKDDFISKANQQWPSILED